MDMEPEQPTAEIITANSSTARPKPKCGLFRRKDMSPDTFDFSISGEGDEKRIVLRIADGRKEVTLSMNQEAVITLMAGLMDTATDMLDIGPKDSKTRDIMYA